MIELQNARLAALNEQKKRSNNPNGSQSQHPHLRQNIANIGAGGSMDDKVQDDEYFPPLPGVLDWLV